MGWSGWMGWVGWLDNLDNLNNLDDILGVSLYFGVNQGWGYRLNPPRNACACLPASFSNSNSNSIFNSHFSRRDTKDLCI